MYTVENTETVGIWTEYLLCKANNIEFNSSREYVKNLNIKEQEEIENVLKFTNVMGKFTHTGQKNSEEDFVLDDGRSLSLKTNISNDKVCPNTVGQTSLSKINKNFKEVGDYKSWVINKPDEVYDFYIKHLLKADHLVYVCFNQGKVFWIKKQSISQVDKSRFTFTKTLDSWKESCSMKLDGKTIAEFQVHNTRDVVKCRFSMITLLKFIDNRVYIIPKVSFKVKKTIGTFNYIGSKTKLTKFLKNSIEEYTCKNLNEIKSFYDLFSGTGSVSSFLIENGCKNIITNDNMTYSYILSSSITTDNIDVDKINSEIKILNNLKPLNGYISQTYSTKRMFFTLENAMMIDSIRTYIETNRNNYTDKEYLILLKMFLYSCSKVANISSTYGAYLKKFKKSATQKLKIQNVIENKSLSTLKNYNENVLDLVKKIKITGDVCYLDPPYNSRKYSSNYFVIEAIAKYTKEKVSDGITGLPLLEPEGSGDFCLKSKVVNSFNVLFQNINTGYLFMSYSSESLLSREEVIKLLKETGWYDISVKEIEYKRFKSNQLTDCDKILYEYLFCAKKT
jgi:adenine-specific DNA-methyltransferase